eukprot:1112768-Amphidinium_carterae.1
MTILGKVRILSRPPTIPECLGASPSQGRSGKGDAGGTLTSATTKATIALGGDLSLAVYVNGPEVFAYHLGSAAAVDTGPARSTWWPRPVWRAMFPCAHVITSWNRNQGQNSLGFVTNGNEKPSEGEAWLSRPEHLCDMIVVEARMGRPYGLRGECVVSRRIWVDSQRRPI